MPSLVTRGQSLVHFIQAVKLITVVDLGRFYCEVPDVKGERQRVYVSCNLFTLKAAWTHEKITQLTPMQLC